MTTVAFDLLIYHEAWVQADIWQSSPYSCMSTSLKQHSTLQARHLASSRSCRFDQDMLARVVDEQEACTVDVGHESMQ